MGKFFAGSWKTTAAGALGGLSLIAQQAAAVLDSDPTTVFSWEKFTAGLALLGVGIFARDNNRSSEQVGVRGPLIGLLLAVGLGLFAAGPAWAEPTPANRQLLWEHAGGADLAGFQLYWAPQAEPAPRAYTNLRRVAIANPTARSIVIIDAKPDATGGLCFRLTAFNAALQESEFSDEVCGFFGFPAATGFRAE